MYLVIEVTMDDQTAAPYVHEYQQESPENWFKKTALVGEGS